MNTKDRTQLTQCSILSNTDMNGIVNMLYNINDKIVENNNKLDTIILSIQKQEEKLNSLQTKLKMNYTDTSEKIDNKDNEDSYNSYPTTPRKEHKIPEDYLHAPKKNKVKVNLQYNPKVCRKLFETDNEESNV